MLIRGNFWQLLNLKAVIYESEAQRKPGAQRAQPTKKSIKEITRNRGVMERAEKDLLAENKEHAVQEKISRYEQLAAGIGLDSLPSEYDDNAPLVDFEMKRVLATEKEAEASKILEYSGDGEGGLVSEDMRREKERREWVQSMLKEVEEDQTRSAKVEKELQQSEETKRIRTGIESERKRKASTKEERLAKLRRAEKAKSQTAKKLLLDM
eukprot:Rmarinus@m.10017